jgi:nucleotide-binding universal stress UspA family protein
LAAPRRNATDLGIAVDVHLLRSTRVAEELIATAEEVQANVLIVGAERRTDGSFLGHTVAHLLQYAPMAVAVVITPRQ